MRHMVTWTIYLQMEVAIRALLGGMGVKVTEERIFHRLIER